MPRVTPKGPGDNAYPRYQRADLIPTSVQVKKGDLYTIGSDGKLAVPIKIDLNGATAKLTEDIDHEGFGIFHRGMFQSTVDLAKDPGASDRVACFGPGTRIIMLAGQPLARGQVVGYRNASSADSTKRVFGHDITDVQTANRVSLNGIQQVLYGAVGRIWDFYDDKQDAAVSDPTYLCEAGDKVIVELGRSF